MKIVAINYSPSVGKTTVTTHLLRPRMPDAKFFSVETTNQSAGHFGVDVQSMRGQDFGQLYQELALLDDAIIDVGASNVEPFLQTMTLAKSSWRQFDLFVVPVTKPDRAQSETIETVKKLNALGVPRDRIKLLFNRVDGDIELLFEGILEFAESRKMCQADTNIRIAESELFDLLSTEKVTVDQLMSENKDYIAEAKKAAKEGRKREASEFVRRDWITKLANGTKEDFDVVFEALTV